MFNLYYEVLNYAYLFSYFHHEYINKYQETENEKSNI